MTKSFALRMSAVSALCLLSGTALAEESEPRFALAASTPPEGDTGPAVLLGKVAPSPRYSWYVAPTAAATTFNAEGAVEAGVRGAFFFTRNFGVGLAGNVLTNDTSYTASSRTVDGAYGGLLLQYEIFPHNLVHTFVDTTIGGGAACMGKEARNGKDCATESTFFTVEPTANLELNLSKNVRLALGGGYRFATAGAGSPLNGGDLGGVVIRTSLMVGQF